MLNSRQRAQLKGLGSKLHAIYQIGKAGLNDELLRQMDGALNNRELVKITVLETCPDDAKRLCQRCSEILKAEPVQVIGRKFVLYRESKEHKTIELVK